jgi:hypothetical protein
MKTRLLVLASLFLASCAAPTASRPQPAEHPPVHTRWVRSYTVEEFEREVQREDAAARAAEARGASFARVFPKPAAWAGVRERNPRIAAVWRYEPDGTDLPSASGEHALRGAGFALVDAEERVIYLHEAIGYMAAP